MANFTPTLAPIHEKSPFRFWCQKVLPTVYDDSLSYYELLTKVVYYLNENTQDLETVNSNVEALYNSYVELQNYVNNYFDQNFPELVEQKLDEMVEDGTFDAMLHAIVDPYFELKSEEIDDALGEQDENIAILQNEWDNFVNAHAGLTTETVLWEGTAFKRNDEFDFDTEDFTDYNYLDFYYRLNTIDTYAPVITRVSTEHLTVTGNYPLLSFVYPTNISDVTDKGLTNDMFAIARVLDTDNVTPLENKLKIAYAKKWTWTGANNADATVLMADESAQAQVAGYIIKVVGIKDTQNDMEVIDARVGYNGTIYQSLGQAIRTQVDDLHDAISTNGISESVKTALLNCFQNVAWINGNGETYYNALNDALNERTLLSISAVYTQTGAVYDTDSLDSLKDDLVVTAYYDDNTTEDVTAVSTLSGTLTVGTSTITATYQDKSATFNVTVSALSYVTNGLIHRWDGIQNTSNGHDSSTTTWEDLVGTYDFDFKDTGGTALAWNNDSLSFNGTSNAYIWTASGESETANDKTIEVVCKPLTQGSSAATITQTFSPGSANADAIGKINIFNDNTVSAKGQSGYTYATGLSSYTAINSIVATFNATPAVNKVYVNNTELSLSTKTHSMRNTYNRMVVGASKQNDTDVGYWFTGKIYAIRIYNRNLSAEEIAQNYAVDVQRFGLV